MSKTFDNVFNEAWSQSFSDPQGTSVKEYGFHIYQKKDNTYVNSQCMSGASGAVNITSTQKTDETLSGMFHTHPYSKQESKEAGLNDGELLRNMAHSGTDISTMRDSEQGFVSIVEAGDRRFALAITDKAKATAFYGKYTKEQINTAVQQALKEEMAKGEKPSQALSNAVRSVIGSENGVGFYRTNDTAKQIWIQTNKTGASDIDGLLSRHAAEEEASKKAAEEIIKANGGTEVKENSGGK